MTLGPDAQTFERCMAVGGVAVFPADTVYGLACDVHSRLAVERLYRFKGRRLDKPSAVMFFDRDTALGAMPELGARTLSALARLLPGGVTMLLPNPERRFPLACGDDITTFGLRVPVVPALEGVFWPVLQSSANLAGGPDPRRLDQVPEGIRRRADLVIDGGELPGTASTVIDMRRFERDGSWSIVRAGAVSEDRVAAALSHQFHFDPMEYLEEIRGGIPDYERLQDEVAGAGGALEVRRVLELGTGTGETARRVLLRHPEARLVGIDESEAMLEMARAALPDGRVDLRVGLLEGELPAGPFDLVVSALCVHHLPGAAKRDLFTRVAVLLRPGGRFVLGDVVVPGSPEEAVIPVTPGYDHPSSVADQLRWLREAGFDPVTVGWSRRDLAVITADVPPAPLRSSA